MPQLYYSCVKTWRFLGHQHRDNWIFMLSAALAILAKKWNHPITPSWDEHLNYVWYTMKLYLVIKGEIIAVEGKWMQLIVFERIKQTTNTADFLIDVDNFRFKCVSVGRKHKEDHEKEEGNISTERRKQ